MSMLENPTPFEKWMFQNAEGVETFPRDKMLEKAFNDGKESCEKQPTEAKEIIRGLIRFGVHISTEDYAKAESFLKENEND